MRNYSDINSVKTQEYLESIANSNTSVEDYKIAMFQLGRSLGEILKQKIRPRSKICLASTVEDADYLSKGILEVLEKDFETSFVCFWNNREKLSGGFQIAPIIKRYTEVKDKSIDNLIVIKSIISGSCVVRTNLTKLLEQIETKNIFVVAPVVYYKAEENLKNEFSSEITDKFKLLYFAVDNEKDDSGNILPGIGGSIYKRLGFNNQEDKNKYIPSIVKTRRVNALR